MSEPPPSPLATTESQPLKLHTSYRPCRASLGSQNAPPMAAGLRRDDPRGDARPPPRATPPTRGPGAASRYAPPGPPKPDPTTTTSTCSLRTRLAPVPLEEVDD